MKYTALLNLLWYFIWLTITFMICWCVGEFDVVLNDAKNYKISEEEKDLITFMYWRCEKQINLRPKANKQRQFCVRVLCLGGGWGELGL